MTTSIPNSAIELVELQRVAQAKATGFAMFPIAAGDGTPAFVYTIGMAQANLPEMLCFVEPGTEAQTLKAVHDFCTILLDAAKRFGRDKALAAFCKFKIDKFSPTFLTGDLYCYALDQHLTRATRYRKELGFPKVIELQHAAVPTLEQLLLQDEWTSPLVR